MSKTLSQKGMSLVEIMVVAGILGFLGLAVSTTFTDLFRMQSKITGNDEANEFAASMGRYLFSESTCSEALLGQPFPVKKSRKLVLPKHMGYAFGENAKDAKGQPIEIKDIREKTQIGAKLEITELNIRDKQMAEETIVYDGKKLKRYLAEISLITRSKVGKKWNDNTPRVYEFPVLVDSGNKIVKCMTSSTSKDACEVLGSEYDTGTGKCRPQAQCFYEGSYTTHTCDNKLSCTPVPSVCRNGRICPKDGKCPDGKGCLPAEECPQSSKDCPPNSPNPINWKLGCPSGNATRNQSGQASWKFTYECGKKCTQTVSVEAKYYICLKCVNPVQ